VEHSEENSEDNGIISMSCTSFEKLDWIDKIAYIYIIQTSSMIMMSSSKVPTEQPYPA